MSGAYTWGNNIPPTEGQKIVLTKEQSEAVKIASSCWPKGSQINAVLCENFIRGLLPILHERNNLMWQLQEYSNRLNEVEAELATLKEIK